MATSWERFWLGLARVPPFTSPSVRLAVLRIQARAGRIRRRLFERFRSARYSRPALFELDRKLERHLAFEGGFFVEAGANDGYVQSNTYYFERFKNWTGILIEPIPELYEQCLVERPRSQVFNYALVAEVYSEPTVKMRYGGLMSIVPGACGSLPADTEHVTVGSRLNWDRYYEVDVPARTLSSVLDEAGAPEVDLLSLDVEGYEPNVLAGLGLERHAPRYVLVEILDEERTRGDIERLLGERYEEVERLSPHDVLFRRCE
jgi:FkbM family methyltransferase